MLELLHLKKLTISDFEACIINGSNFCMVDYL